MGTVEDTAAVCDSVQDAVDWSLQKLLEEVEGEEGGEGSGMATPSGVGVGGGTPSAVLPSPGLPIDPDRRLIVVANRLPVTLSKSPTGEYTFKMSSGGLVSALVSVRSKVQFIWIGWLGKEVPEADHGRLRKQLMDEFACCPVFLSDKVAGPYYNGFANAELWPRFHYEQRGIREEPLDWTWWDAYQDANEQFCDVVSSVATGKDLVWVHDYHLMLLPRLLRHRVPGATLGWFLHTPFPASSMFRTLPVRADLLHGLLACDVLGFHTFDYCRHFISSCARVLPGVDVSPTSVTLPDGWSCQMMVDPIGIEPDDFYKIASSPTCQSRIADLRRQFEGVRVIVAVDRLDPIKGMPHRLLGLRHFFQTHPQFIGRVTLIQVAVPSRVDVDAYKKLTDTVNALVGSINGEFSTLTCQAVHYFYRSIAPEELCALYSVGDVALITSLRDGMNLVSEEYVACQRLRATNPGVLILSEFAGAAQSLAGSLPCNPWDPASISATLHHAFTMAREEKVARWRQLHDHITTNTSQHWAMQFVRTLSALQARAPAMQPPLTRGDLLDMMSSTGGVLVLLDVEATWPLVDAAAPPTPTPATRALWSALATLATDMRVTVVAISTRPMAVLDAVMKDYPSLHVVAESGACIRVPLLLNLPAITDVTSSLGRTFAKQLAMADHPLTFVGGKVMVHRSTAGGGSDPTNTMGKDFFARPVSSPPAATTGPPGSGTLPTPYIVTLPYAATAGWGAGMGSVTSATTPITIDNVPATMPIHAVRLTGGTTPTARSRGDGTAMDRLRSHRSLAGGGGGGAAGHIPRSVAVAGKWYAVSPGVAGAPVRILQSPGVMLPPPAGEAAPAPPATALPPTTAADIITATNVRTTPTKPPLTLSPTSMAGQTFEPWQRSIEHVVQRYADMTPGTQVVQTTNTVQWRVLAADPELAAWQLKQLGMELETLATPVPVEVIVSKTGAVIRPRYASLSHALVHVLDDLVMNGYPLPHTIISLSGMSDDQQLGTHIPRIQPVLKTLISAAATAAAATAAAAAPPSTAPDAAPPVSAAAVSKSVGGPPSPHAVQVRRIAVATRPWSSEVTSTPPGLGIMGSPVIGAAEAVPMQGGDAVVSSPRDRPHTATADGTPIMPLPDVIALFNSLIATAPNGSPSPPLPVVG